MRIDDKVVAVRSKDSPPTSRWSCFIRHDGKELLLVYFSILIQVELFNHRHPGWVVTHQMTGLLAQGLGASGA